MKYIELKNVTFAYDRGNEPAVRQLNLTISQGEFVVFAGLNGSGKSTLLRLINGLLIPQSGQVIFNGLHTCLEKNLIKIRQQAGMVFQDPENQITSTIVEEDTAFGPENLSFSRERMETAVKEVLALTELTDLRHRSTSALSAGQQQRLALAGILAMSPDCLLLDEPTSMLNPGARHSFLTLIEKLQKERGMTIIMVSHRLEEILLAPRMIVINKGVIAGDGSPSELLKNDNLNEWGLTPPPALRASRLLKNRENNFPELLYEIELAREIQKSKQPGLKKSLRDLYSQGKKRGGEILPGDSIMEINNLSHDYLKGTIMENRALQSVNFSLRKGETAVLIGSTGSGKSTLLQHMNGLLLPDEGVVKILNIPINHKTVSQDIHKIRKTIGLIMQRPERQLFERYVGDDVAFAPRQLGLKGKELAHRVKDSMELAGLSFIDFKDRPVHALSGGEKRKAAIAGVLAMKPSVLLMDEPSAGLDPLSRDELYRMMEELKAQGTAIVLSTHDMDEAYSLGDRIFLLDKGILLTQGTADEIFSQSDLLKKHGLGLPFVQRIEALYE
jgi:energy-coupling factor transporter ATPase